MGDSLQRTFKKRRKNLQATLDHYGLNDEAEYYKKQIKDSTEIFKTAFGYTAKSFIVPAYTWHHNIHKYLANADVKTLQGIKLQYEPRNQKKLYNRKLRYIGKTDINTSLVYAPRNAFLNQPTNLVKIG